MREPVDLARLREFSDGTEEGFRTLTCLFLADVDEVTLALARAIEQCAMAEVAAVAHRAGGTAGACGAAALAEALFRMESAAHVHRAGDATALWPAVEQELAAVRRFLAATIAMDGVRG